MVIALGRPASECPASWARAQSFAFFLCSRRRQSTFLLQRMFGTISRVVRLVDCVVVSSSQVRIASLIASKGKDRLWASNENLFFEDSKIGGDKLAGAV